MIQEKTILKEPGDKAIFSVPEGYFEELSARMDGLIDQTEQPKHSSTNRVTGKLVHMRPLLYMAASLVVVLFCIGTVLKLKSNQSDSTKLTENSVSTQQTAEDYLINQVGTYRISEYYVDPEQYDE